MLQFLALEFKLYDREHVWPQSLSNDLYGTSNAGQICIIYAHNKEY
jgi:hypothetical protein